jgi:microcystin synthetase protein McyJ
VPQGARALDVGFGLADQDRLWAGRLGLRIVGLNITREQVAEAAARFARRPAAPQPAFLAGDATRIPLADESVDAVLALECAFHFNTRADFLVEAWRVLKPGGVIALADGVVERDVLTGWGPRSLARRALAGAGIRFWHIPIANLRDEPHYRGDMDAAGFGDVRIRRIGASVFPGIARWLQGRACLARFPWWDRPFVWAAGESFRIPWDRGWYDYILAAGVKPA